VFVRNNPVHLIDPFGLDAIGDLFLLRAKCNYWFCKNEMRKKRKEIMDKASSEARNLTGGVGFDGGPMDTMRHCLAGCYLSRAMRDTSSCSEVPPEAFIREEEMKRSANKSQIDIDNGVVGSQAPSNVSCASYCMQAFLDGRIKNEKPGPWPLPKPYLFRRIVE